MPISFKSYIESDLDELLQSSCDLWPDLRNAKIFITGGTGFLGRWLVESFLYANEHLQLNASITVLSRNPAAFLNAAPYLKNNSSLLFWQGDVRNFVAPAHTYTHLIHAATESSGMQKHHSALHMHDTIVAGTRRVLDFARNADVKKMIYISSAAVYGRNRTQTAPLTETDLSSPLITDNAIEYDESKRMAEALCMIYHKEFALPVNIARGFSFVGPYLPMQEHFAIGNFIHDAVKGQTIKVNSTGTAIRSYLYAADFARWIWAILLKGSPANIYNVGSDKAVSIAELANMVQKNVNSKMNVQIADAAPKNATLNYQVPNISKAHAQLGLYASISLEESIKRTAAWHKKALSIKAAVSDKSPSILAEPDAIIFDFDGVMTDNSVVLSEEGLESVFCNRADGLGIAKLRERALPILVLSTEKNPVVSKRCKKLGIECLQGIDIKEKALAQWLKKKNFLASRSIFVGNDINDLGCLKMVGCPVAVSDAYDEVKKTAHLILSKAGGKGAVREIADMICAAQDSLLKDS